MLYEEAMASSDAVDMMDTETPAVQSSSSDQAGADAVRGLLLLARQLVDQAKPSQALQAVVMAMKTKGGDEAVLHVMNRARELYRNKLQTSAAADQLASLFAECAIAEALPSKPEQQEAEYTTMVEQSMIQLDSHGTSSILAESGRNQIVLDAFSDGSNFVCLQCGGLVGVNRRDEHYAYWCCKI